MNRLTRAWKALTGPKIQVPEKIYVYPSEYNPSRFVQLVPWRDEILALDAEGKVWNIRLDYSGGGLFIYEFLMESPRRY